MRSLKIFFPALFLVSCLAACDISHPDTQNDPGATDSIDYPENDPARQSENTYNVDSTMSTVGPDNAKPLEDTMPSN